MLMLMRHYDGRREEAVMLSVAGNAMRVAVPGREDCLELRLYDGQWVTETYEAIEIEYIGGTAEDVWRQFVDAMVGLDEVMSGVSTAAGGATAVS